MRTNHIYLLTLFAYIFLYSCKKDKKEEVNPAYTPTPFSLDVPSNFPQIIIPEDNPTTVEGVILGRRLYYDTLLSNNGLACASCHNQQYGFTTPQANITRILPHVNLAWSTYFLWDGKIEGKLEDIMAFEVEDFFNTEITKLQNHPEYPQLFKKSFGSDLITFKEVEYALAQFFRTLISGNSKFDKYLRHEVMLTPSELNGFVLFNTEKGDCFHCHSLPLMTDNNFHNIGVDSLFSPVNSGRYLVTGNLNDIGKFKTPTLRNVELRPSYMHDGRFSSLEEVIEHYNSGVLHSATLDPIMTKSGKELGLQLTTQEKADLVSFLKTLTDTMYIHNPAYSNPFR